MAAASSSGNGGHGRCWAETAREMEWSETLAFRFSFHCLFSVSQSDAFQAPATCSYSIWMLSRKINSALQNCFGIGAPQAAKILSSYPPPTRYAVLWVTQAHPTPPWSNEKNRHGLCVLGGAKHCHLLLLNYCLLFGLWERRGIGGVWPKALLFHLFYNLKFLPFPPSALKPAFGYRVVGTHLNTDINNPSTSSFPPPLPVIMVTPSGSAQRGFQSVIRRVISRLNVHVYASVCVWGFIQTQFTPAPAHVVIISASRAFWSGVVCWEVSCFQGERWLWNESLQLF